MEKHLEKPELRLAQKTLAYEVVKDIHSRTDADTAVKISESLFTGNINDLSDEEIELAFKGVPTYTVNEDSIINILVNNKIASSRREAREFLSNNAITLNGDIINDENYQITKAREYHLIRRGKKKFYLIKMN